MLSVAFSTVLPFVPEMLASCVLFISSWLFGLDSFFHFILLFWNHVFTWVSFKPRVCASLARLDVSKYFCSANVFSKTRSWRSVNTVRDFLHRRPLGVRRVGLTRKYTGNWLNTSGLGSEKDEIFKRKSQSGCAFLQNRCRIMIDCWNHNQFLYRTKMGSFWTRDRSFTWIVVVHRLSRSYI